MLSFQLSSGVINNTIKHIVFNNENTLDKINEFNQLIISHLQ